MHYLDLDSSWDQYLIKNIWGWTSSTPKLSSLAGGWTVRNPNFQLPLEVITYYASDSNFSQHNWALFQCIITNALCFCFHYQSVDGLGNCKQRCKICSLAKKLCSCKIWICRKSVILFINSHYSNLSQTKYTAITGII